MNAKMSGLKICVHGADGSMEVFAQHEELVAARVFDGLQPARLFVPGNITIAGTYSLTAFATSRIARIDFIRENLAGWEFPSDVVDVVELSEAEFHEKARLSNPDLMKKREQPHVTGVTVMGYLNIKMLGGLHVFLAVERVVDLPVERLNTLHFLLTTTAVHFRLREGGFGVLNLANMVRFTAYPGPDRTPANAWPAHHSANI